MNDPAPLARAQQTIALHTVGFWVSLMSRSFGSGAAEPLVEVSNLTLSQTNMKGSVVYHELLMQDSRCIRV